MTSGDIRDEMAAYEQRLRGNMEQLARLGIVPGLAKIGQHQPAVGLANVRYSSGGWWEPDEAGELAMIVAACTPHRFEAHGQPIETVNLVDLIAFNSRSPATWSWRRGVAWALGEAMIEHPDGRPVRLVSTPLAWLGAGGEAACVLDWSDNSPAWAHLRAAGDLIVDCPNMRAKLDMKIRASVRLPRMEVSHA